MLKGLLSETRDTQTVFRKLLSAMASPGEIGQVDINLNCPGSLHPASGAILLTMLDYSTPFWSDLENGSKEIQWIRFHTGAPFVHMKSRALFALAVDYDRLVNPDSFNPGTLESPDHSTTLLVQTRGVGHNGRIRLTGPGIPSETYLKLGGIKETFLKRRATLIQDYPLGIDMIFISDDRFVAIPRTTVMEVL